MLIWMWGCASDKLVEPLVSAEVAALEEVLPVSTRVGLGGVSLAAAVCPLSHQAWIDLATGESDDAEQAQLAVSDELVDLLGLAASTTSGDGLVRYDDETGTATVTWNEAVLEDGWDVTTVELEMLSAQAHFLVTIDPVGDLDLVEIEASFVSCDTKAQVDAAEGSWERGGAEESFYLPPEGFEAEDESDLPYWIGGKPWPQQGKFAWAREAEGEETVKVTSLDAAQIDSSQWPASATTRSWSADVLVPLGR